MQHVHLMKSLQERLTLSRKKCHERIQWFRNLTARGVLRAIGTYLLEKFLALVRISPAIIIVSVSCGAYLLFGIHHLAQFQTADEDLWVANPEVGRMQDFWHAMDHKDWAGTRVNDKPGSTMMLISGYFGRSHDTNTDGKVLHGNKVIRQYGPEENEKTLYYYRLPILLANGILVLLMFFFLIPLLENALTAAVATSFIYLSPILLGLSQIINPDATLWSFFAAALFAYLAFLKEAKWRYFIFAPICAGLALASKYSATILLVFLFCATFFALYFRHSFFPDRKAFAKYARHVLIGYGLFLAGTLYVFTLAFPAAYVNHDLIRKGTIGFNQAKDVMPILRVLISIYGAALFDALILGSRVFYSLFRFLRHFRMPITYIFSLVVAGSFLFVLFNWSYHNFLEFSDVPFDLGRDKEFQRLPELDKMLLEIKPIVFTTTSITLVLAFLALLFPGFRSKNRGFVVGALAAFIIAFYIAVYKQNLLVHVRYSNMLYPIISVLAAIGISGIAQIIEKRYQHFVMTGMCFVALGVNILTLLSARPYYFNYTNSFLPRDMIITGAWGYGGYEAAQELNKLPNADTLVVWASYDGFCPFFKGQCVEGSTIKWYKGGDFTQPDYYVVSRRGLIRNKSTWGIMTGNNIVDEKNPYWELNIDDRPGNFVRIYKVNKLANMPAKIPGKATTNPPVDDASGNDAAGDDDSGDE